MSDIREDAYPRSTLAAILEKARKAMESLYAADAKKWKDTLGEQTVTLKAADWEMLKKLIGVAYDNRAHWSGGPDSASNVTEALCREVAIQEARQLIQFMPVELSPASEKQQ